MDALVDTEAHVVHHHVGVSEVDDHLGARVGDVEHPVTGVDHRDQFHVVGGVDRLTHLGAHPATSSEHPDPDRVLRRSIPGGVLTRCHALNSAICSGS